MKPETRANLFFLCIFLAVSLPGAVILFKKKLDPSAPPMWMPEGIRQRLPYMAPQATPGVEVTRVIPDKTARWVEQLNRARGGGDGVLMHQREPVTSDDHVLQVTGVTGPPQQQEQGGATTVSLIAWDGGFGTDAGRYRVTASMGGGAGVPGQVLAAEAIPLPEEIRRELMYGGYIQPPHTVTWLRVRFDGAMADNPPVTMRVEYSMGAATAASTVNVFTK
ncbi:MAG TPA: hypothetical protein VH475_13320 [Tepidisphaeraceae bacterium]|jgi:hypothetical protein